MHALIMKKIGSVAFLNIIATAKNCLATLNEDIKFLRLILTNVLKFLSMKKEINLNLHRQPKKNLR